MGNLAASYHREHVSPDVDRKIFAAIGGIGAFCALTVFVEMCEKLAGTTTPNWSALRLMGPQIWLPLKSKEDYNVAIIILIFSIMYAAACGLLIYGGWKRIRDLPLTWKLTESGVLLYQMLAALITSSSFTAVDSVLLSFDTLLGVAALVYTRVAESAWYEDADSDEEERRERRGRRSPSPSPPPEDISDEPEPVLRPREVRRSLEALAGPGGAAGPSGVARPAPDVELQEMNGDSDSMEGFAAAVMEAPPVITPRRKKSSAQVTVHGRPEDLREITVDPDRALRSITEESASDTSHGSSPAAPRESPQRPAEAEGAEASQEGSTQGASTSTAEPAPSTEQPVAAETAAPQEAAPSTVQDESVEQIAADPVEATSVNPRPSTEVSEVPAEAETAREETVSAGRSAPSQEAPSAAESSEADTEAGEKSADGAPALSAADAESQSAVATDSSQVASPVATVAADSRTVEAEHKAATGKTEQTAMGAGIDPEVEETRL